MKRLFITMLMIGVLVGQARGASWLDQDPPFVAKAPMDIVGFDSPETMWECISQLVMGDGSLLNAAGAAGKAIAVRKGATIMVMDVRKEARTFTFKVKGVVGTWFSHTILFE